MLDGRLIDNASHLARLQRSVSKIALKLPETPERIQEIQQELIARNQLVNGMVYLEVTRGADSGRDFAFPRMRSSRPGDVYLGQGHRQRAVGEVRHCRDHRTRHPLGAPRHQERGAARTGARQAGRGGGGRREAWMIEDGKVTEGGSSSAFILTQDDVLVTRHNSSAILPGCTRKAVVLAEERQFRVEERPFTVEEALAAKEAFTTSATLFVQAVVSIDGKTIGNGRPGPMTNRLREIYLDFALRNRRLDQRFLDSNDIGRLGEHIGHVWMTGSRLASSMPAMMRALSSCFDATRM